MLGMVVNVNEDHHGNRGGNRGRLFFDYFELNKNLLGNDLSVKVKRYLKETNYISLNDIDFRKKNEAIHNK